MVVAKAQLAAREWLIIIGMVIGVLMTVFSGGTAAYVAICERLTALETNQQILINLAYEKMTTNANPNGNAGADAAVTTRHR